MRVLRHIATLLCLLLCSTAGFSAEACGNPARRVHYGGYVRASHLSSSGVNLWVAMENGSCHDLVLRRGEITILVKGLPAATISLRDKVVVPRRSSEEVLLPLRFTSHGLVGAWQLVRRIATGRGEDVTLSYRLRAGTRLFKRNFSAEEVAISEFFNNFAISDDFIRALSGDL